MSTFKRFEDILAWQRAREVTRIIYELTNRRYFAKDYGLRDQLRRSTVSITANIAEGFGRRSNKEFANFLSIAHASAAESQSHLFVALDLGYLDREESVKLYSLFDECSRMTIGLSKHLCRC